MAKAFNLTAQLNLTGPNNLKPIVSKIRKELGSIKADIKFNINTKASKSIDDIKNKLVAMNAVLVSAKNNTNDLNASLRNLSTSLASVKGGSGQVSASVNAVAKSATSTAKNLKEASSQMEEFGKQGYLAVKRFAAFSIVAGSIYRLVNAVTDGVRSFIEFDKQLVKLEQVTGDSSIALKGLSNEITNLAVTLGVSSSSLLEVASTLAQAGLSANETRQALSALAKTELAPSFDNLTDTTEGAIAAMRQFGIATKDLEKALGSINAVAAGFAVESSDIIVAIQRAGGAFAASSNGVSQGTDALNEFIAIFTSVRATTRESAETIATGLRTIFTRIQRPQTIEFLRQFGVELTDIEGKFVGPYEAVKRLSTVLKTLDPRDLRFAQIVEELGGFRQISKVIPVIQQFSEAQKALKVAQEGQGSLTKAQEIAQKSLAVRLAKVREEFLALIKTVAQSDTFQGFFTIVVNLSSALIKLAGAFKPILPALAILGAIKGGKALTEFAGGFFSSFKQGGGAKAAGSTLGGGITGSREKETAEVTNRASEALTKNTSALSTLTSSIDNLIRAINNRGGGATLNKGGTVRAFARGGVVPGSGNRDTVPAMLTPGEFVIRKKAVETIGAGNLQKMNRYAGGGIVNITAKELQNRTRGSKAVQDLITDSADPSFYKSGRAINREDNISFIRNAYKLYEPDLKDDASAFEDAVATRTNGIRTNIGKQDPNFPIDITNSSYGPLEVRNRVSSTSNRTLLDKLLRYYISSNQYNRLSNSPAADSISLGKLGIVYNSAKYDPPNAKELNKGGLIQKFLLGGTVEETSQLENMTLQEAAIAWITELGGIEGVKQTSGIPNGDRTLNGVLRANNINSENPEKLKAAIDAINKALGNEKARKVREAQNINKMMKLGIVGLEPLGYSQDEPFDTKFGKAALLIRGLPNTPQYANAVSNLQGGVSNLGRGFARELQNAALTDTKPLVLDFDKTLVDGADILDANGKQDIPAYSDLNKVKESLKNGALTALGEKLKSLLELDPSFIDNIRILTARPQSNASLLSERLNQLGLPIPASKITGISGGNKGKSMQAGETLIDDDIENIMNAINAGQGGKYYTSQLRNISDAEARAKGRANAEGALLELALSELGAYGGIIKENSVDFEQGLGLQAAGIFGIPPDILTEVKRTLSSAAIGRAKDQFTRYLNELDTAPGIGSDVYSISKNTGLPVSRFAEGGEAYSPQQLVALAKYRGMDSKSINMYLSNKSGFKKWAQENDLSEENIQETIDTAEQLITMFKNQESLKGSARKNKLYSGVKGGKLKTILNQIGNPLNSNKDIPEAIGKTFNLGGSLLSTSESYDTAAGFAQGISTSSAIMSILRKKNSPSIDVDETIFDTSTEDQVLKALSGYKDKATGETGSDILSYVRKRIRMEKEFILPPDAKFRIKDIDNIYPKDDLDKTVGGNIRFIEGMKVEQFAKGGSAQDTVPALLTPGEFVINKKAAQKIGYGELHKLNKADKLQGYNKGGFVGGIQRFAIGGTPKPGAGGSPTTIAALEDAANRAGISLAQLEKQLKQQSIAKSLEKIAQMKGNRADLRTEITRAAAKGLGNRESRKELASRLQQRIKDLNPSAKDSDINKAVGEIFKGIKNGKTFDEMLASATASLKPLTEALDGSTDNVNALQEAQAELIAEFGGLTDAMRATTENIESTDYKQSGKAAADFGMFGNIFTDQALAFKKSAAGSKMLDRANKFQTLGIDGLNDALSQLPGPIGEAVKAVGGLPGVIAGVSSMFGDLLTQMEIFGDSVAGAGLAGALSGAGSQAISLGTLGQQLGGPIGGMIGVISGAIGGAIDGFLQGAKIKELENSMAGLNDNIEAANIALDNLSKLDTQRNYEIAAKSVDSFRDNINDLAYQAQSTLGEKATSGLSGLAIGGGMGYAAGLGIGLGLPGAGAAATAAGLTGLGTALTGLAATVSTGGIALIVAGVAALGYGIYKFVQGTPEIDKQALEGQLKAIENYTKGLSQLAERKIKLTSLADIERDIKDFEAAKTPEDKRDIGLRSATLGEAAKGAELRGQSVEEAKRQAAIALAMQELNRIYGGNTKAIQEQSKNTEELYQRGLELAAEQDNRIKLEVRMAAAMREVNLQTESLTEIFDKMTASTERFGLEMDRSQTRVDEMADAMSGNFKVGTVNRRDEEILKNSQAYSQAEFDAVLSRVSTLAGGGANADKLTQSLQAQRIIQQSLPGILRGTTKQDVGSVRNQLETLFTGAGITGDTQQSLLDQITEKLEQETEGRQGKSFEELAQEFPALQKSMETYNAANAAAANILKQTNDQLTRYGNNLDKINDATLKNLELSTKADEIRYDTAVKLGEIYGRKSTITSADVKDNEIRRLAQEGGAGATTDPRQIGASLRGVITQIDENRKKLEQDPGNTTLLEEQGKLVRQANVLNQALEELANNSERTAQIMNDFQEYEQQKNKSMSFAERALTADSEELSQMKEELDAATAYATGNVTAAQAADPEFRKKALAGLEMMPFPEDQAKKLKQQLIAEMITALPGGQGAAIMDMPALPTTEEGETPKWVDVFRSKIEDAFADKIEEANQARQEAVKELKTVQDLIITTYTEQNKQLITSLADLTTALNNITATPAPATAGAAATAAAAAAGSGMELEPDRAANPVIVSNFRNRLQNAYKKRWLFSQKRAGTLHPFSNKEYETALQELEQIKTDYKDTFGELPSIDDNDWDGGQMKIRQDLEDRAEKARQGTATPTYRTPAQSPTTPTPTPIIPRPATATTPTGTPAIPTRAATTDRTAPPTAAATTNVGLLTIDESTKTFLTQFKASMDSFGSYVTRMENIANTLPKLPERIEMQGRHTVQVTITGDKVWNALEGKMLEFIQGEVDKKMQDTWRRSGGELGSSGAGGSRVAGRFDAQQM